MSFDTGPTPPSRLPTSTPVPESPPAEVLDAVGVAADRADALAAQDRELHFHRDPASGRVLVQLRELSTGEVVRTIPASHALDVLSDRAPTG
jgi:hypothetical protein